MQKDVYLELSNLASSISKEAGKLLLAEISQNQSVIQDLDRDVKVFADNLVDRFIVRNLVGKTNFPVLSEESGLLGTIEPEHFLWIVDPLDGSLNFSRGIPLNCISIGLWKDKDPVMGVIYDFNRDELFTGITQEGAWLNGVSIKVSQVNKCSDAILCTGFPVSSDFSGENILKFVEDIRKFKKVRLLGSAALSMAYIACGRADCYWEKNIKIWDVAAGIAIVSAAGGIVQNNWLGENNLLDLTASNGFISSFL